MPCVCATHRAAYAQARLLVISAMFELLAHDQRAGDLQNGNLLGKACSLPLPGGVDYLREVRAGIEADRDSPPESKRE